MTTQFTATVVNGMLKADGPLPFAEQSRVRLTIEPMDDRSQAAPPAQALAAWEAIQARLEERPIHGGGLRYTRDELRERRDSP